MNERTHDHFTPRGTLSREQLRAYAEGRLDAAAAHDVERHLEADPLLRDALEGLQQPGALAGLEVLRGHAPSASVAAWIKWSLSAALVGAVGAVVYVITPADPVDERAIAAQVIAPDVPTTPTGIAVLDSVELANAIALPESLHIGHAPTDRHSLAQAHNNKVVDIGPVERQSIEPVEPKDIRPQAADEVRNATPEGPHRPSLQLVYLHDLKLLHPRELYGRSPEIERLTNGLDARFATATEEAEARSQERRVAYLGFMDEALARFVENDHKGCLEELTFVLDQYPDDVNALFYAGLCSYNLGLNERAERYLHAAATHPLRVFDEEAEWYHALALERTGAKEAARAEFERIARSSSFYAARAQGKLIR